MRPGYLRQTNHRATLHASPEARISIDTKTEVHVMGFVVQRKDGNKQIAEIVLSKTK